VRRKCALLGVSRSSLYYEPATASPAQLEIMRILDQQYLKTPFFGARRMREKLLEHGYSVSRARVRRLMRLMSLDAIYQKPKTSKASKKHKKYPYLLRDLVIDRPGQVSTADITYIPMARGFIYLVAVMDWHSRFVLGWRLSNTMEATFCVETFQDSLAYGVPEISNTDQGSQFTGDDYIDMLKMCGIAISMDGKGRWVDNVFVERLWRSLKYEEVYLKAYDTIAEARAGIAAWIEFYNYERPHQALGYKTPWEVFKDKKQPVIEAEAKLRGNTIEGYPSDMVPYSIPRQEREVIRT
jgi:putative transposase